MGEDSSTEDVAPPEPATPGLTACKRHGLRYDPAINVGCVLCRREPPTQRLVGRSTALGAVVTVLAAAVIVAAGLSLSKPPDSTEPSTPAAMVAGSTSLYAGCYVACAERHQSCVARCREQPADATCHDLCFSEADRGFTECVARYMMTDPPWSYYYGTANMPQWSAVLGASVGVRDRLLACSEGPVAALALVSVRAQDGSTTNVEIWGKGMDGPVRACARTALAQTQFAASQAGDYEFLARFDSRYDDTRMLVAQAEAEIDALPRRHSDSTQEATKSLLFDAKVRLEQRRSEPPPPEEAELAAAKARLAALRAQLEAAPRREERASRPTLFSYPAPAPKARVNDRR